MSEWLADPAPGHRPLTNRDTARESEAGNPAPDKLLEAFRGVMGQAKGPE